MSAGLAEVTGRLAALQAAAEGLVGRRSTEVTSMRDELAELAGRWRWLLEQHLPGPDGRCPVCPGRWWGRRVWPCRVWTVAHCVLIRAEGAPALRVRTARGARPADPAAGPVAACAGAPAARTVRGAPSRPGPVIAVRVRGS